MLERVKRNGPSANTRASSIGNECERAIVYERTVNAEDRVAHSPRLQAIFDLGHEDENIVLRWLEMAGIQIIQRGRDYLWREEQISGHVDATLLMPGWPEAIPAELKSLNPYTGESIHSLDDIKNHRQSWVRRYYSQLQTYLLLAGKERGLFVLFNKSTGWITCIDVPLDYEFAESLLQKAKRVKLPPRQQYPARPHQERGVPALPVRPSVRAGHRLRRRRHGARRH